MTNRANSDFIALAVSTINECFEREILVVNMERMTDRHTAEHIKECVESMINKYNFDKKKLKCNYFFIILKLKLKLNCLSAEIFFL